MASIFFTLGLMENPEPALFDIPLGPTGKLYLKKMVGTTTWIFVGGLILSAFALVSTLLRASFEHAEHYSRNYPLYLEIKLRPWYIFVIHVIGFIELYLYWRFARRAKAAIDSVDAEQFNESFADLFKSTQWMIVAIAIDILFYCLILWIDIVHYQNSAH
jgi:hypothetical protein